MLDEASLARLAEMGIDVYVPRAAPGVAVATPIAASAALPSTRGTPAAPGTATPSTMPGRVLVLASVSGTGQMVLMANVVRALRFAGIETRPGDVGDEAALGSAAALIVFGDALVRGVGAVLPSQRQREIGFVVAGDLGALARDGGAKRALWSELRRLTRSRSTSNHGGIDSATRRG